MPVKLKSEYKRAYGDSREQQEQGVDKAGGTRVLRVREPAFTRKRRAMPRMRDGGVEEETVAARREVEGLRDERNRPDMRLQLQPRLPASEYQLQYLWKDPTPRESPLLIADHMLFGQTRNISGATQKDVIPRQSEYRSQFVDHYNQPPRTVSQPHAVTEEDGLTVAMPRDSGLSGKVVGHRPRAMDDVQPPRERREVQSEPERDVPPRLDFHNRRRRRQKSTYRASYKSPTKYLYGKGAYVSPAKKARDADSLSSWFAQVLELRQLAQRYERRSRGTYFSRDHLIEMEGHSDVAMSDTTSDTSSVSVGPILSQPVTSKPRLPIEARDRPPGRRGRRTAPAVRRDFDDVYRREAKEKNRRDVDKQLFVRRSPPLRSNDRDSEGSELELKDVESSEDEEEGIRHGRSDWKATTGTQPVAQQQGRSVAAVRPLFPRKIQTQPVKSEPPQPEDYKSAIRFEDQEEDVSHRREKQQTDIRIPTAQFFDQRPTAATHIQPNARRSRDPLIGCSSVNMGPRHSFQSHTVPIVRHSGHRSAPVAYGMTPNTPEKDPLIGQTAGFGPRHSFQSQAIPILKPGEEWGDIEGQPVRFKTQRIPRNREVKAQLKFGDGVTREKTQCTCGVEEGGKQAAVEDDEISDTASILSESQSTASETLERAKKRQHFWP